MNQQALREDETQSLIAADKVDGTTVRNREGDKLGSIKNVMIDKPSGRVAYAVMSFGGFLGIGEKYHPLPWSVLSYDENVDAYVVNLDKETLEKAPTISSDEDISIRDRRWGEDLHRYYNTPPYWI